MPAQSILIVKLSSMGDVIHTLPAARHLRAAFPEAKLGWAVEEPHAELLKGQPWLDEVIIWRRKNLRTYREFLRRLRKTRWDLAIDFQGIFRSAGLVTRWSRARRRIGFSPSNELAHWFYSDRVPRPPKDCHAVEWYLRLAGAVTRVHAPTPKLDVGHSTFAQCPSPQPSPQRGEGATSNVERSTSNVQRRTSTAASAFALYPSLADYQAVDEWLRRQAIDLRVERLVVLCPDARRQANRWPEEKWTALASRLSSLPGVRVALCGGPASRERCDRIAAAGLGDILRADGQFRLLGSGALFARAACVVTGDTGPMHLAVAMGAKVVALHGPTNPRWTGPYAEDAIVLTRSLACSPCKTAGRCPLRFNPPACMEQISVEETLAAVLRQLDQGHVAAA